MSSSFHYLPRPITVLRLPAHRGLNLGVGLPLGAQCEHARNVLRRLLPAGTHERGRQAALPGLGRVYYHLVIRAVWVAAAVYSVDRAVASPAVLAPVLVLVGHALLDALPQPPLHLRLGYAVDHGAS